MSQPITGQGGHLVFPIGPKNTNLVEDIVILLPVKYLWNPFNRFRGEVENALTNQRPGRPSCFSDRPEKHKLWDPASCQVSLNSVQRFQTRSRKCVSQSEARAAILLFRSAQKHKLGRGRWILASCQVSLNSVQWFQRRSRKYEKLTTTDDGQRMITIVHLSFRHRCTKNHVHWEHLDLTFGSTVGLVFVRTRANLYSNIVATFRGMHVSPAKQQCVTTVSSVTTRQTRLQTDRRRTKWSLCAAMLRRRHKTIFKEPNLNHDFHLKVINILLTSYGLG